jgi:GTP-binding protein YchF
MKIAIAGLPQTGKKTLFSLLSGREIEHRKPGEIINGRALIRDVRVDKISALMTPEKTTYAENQFALCPDIELGTKEYGWLQEARISDLLCIVLREFSSETVFHSEGSVDPERDKENIKMELLFADLDLIDKRLHKMAQERKVKKPTSLQVLEEQTLLKSKATLEANQLLNTLGLTEEEIASVRSLNFVTLKKILWCYNVDEDKINLPHAPDCIRISASIEKDIMAMSDLKERNEYLQTIGVADSGIDRLNTMVYDLLGLMSFYTMGKDEVRAWTISKNTPAPVAAGKIHSDLERGFIRVEIVKYNDLMELKTEQAVKTAGRTLLKGRDYVIADGDICHFLFNV